MTTSSRPLRVGLIGGGVSGLTAAYEAVKRGHSAEVFEASPEVGGLASSFDFHGVAVDRYYHFICGADRALVELIEELGKGAYLHWRPTLTSHFRVRLYASSGTEEPRKVAPPA